MVPNKEGFSGTYKTKSKGSHQPRLSMESLQRSISDLSLGIMNNKEPAAAAAAAAVVDTKLSPITEVEDAKCECCGMGEECTPGYIKRVKEKFSGKLICGLCAEAVKEEIEKNGGNREEALSEHMNACSKFNRFGRAYPVLLQAEAMRGILKKNRSGKPDAAAITRTSSCIPAIGKEIKNTR